MGPFEQQGTDDAVGRALEAWRSEREAPQSLSSSARSSLFSRISSNSAAAAPQNSMLFPPLRRWALAAGIPLVLTMGLAWLGERGSGVSPSPTRIQAVRQGGDVVFTIANGRRQHQVLKSQTPDRFDVASAIRVRNGGSFRDGAESGPDLVFYRID